MRNLLAPLMLSAALLAPALRAQSNVLMLIADDVGVDKVGAYLEGGQVPATPNLDALAAGGVLFRNVWSNATSSTTRATMLTGRYSFRTGIGYLVLQDNSTAALALSETIVPEMLELAKPGVFRHAAIGKWHLGNPSVGGAAAPNLAGFQYYAGILTNMEGTDSYYSWQKTVQGITHYSTTYVTTDQVDEAIAWINAQPGPWYCQVWLWAGHAPYLAPPPALCGCTLPPPTPHGDVKPYYDASVTAMDAEIGRLLASIPPAVLANTNIVFSADNGTPAESTSPPFLPAHAKPTVYEGGIRVPLIVKGPAVVAPGREVKHLVNTVDFFRTVLDLVGISPLPFLPAGTKLDAVSILPYLHAPSAPAQREWIYSELFFPVLFPTKRAMRNDQYKFIQEGALEQFYDLKNDPFETHNLLLGPMSPLEQRNYRQLKLKIAELLAS